MKKNLVLIGFMGTGKSFLGQKIAVLTGKEFIDFDAYFESKEDMEIAAFFQEKGEAFFREKETLLVKELAQKEDVVLATGGGVINNEENMEILQKSGFIVFLDTSFTRIWERIKDSKERPLVQTNSQDELEVLYKKRLPFYRKWADLVLKVENENADLLAQKVLRQWLSSSA